MKELVRLCEGGDHDGGPRARRGARARRSSCCASPPNPIAIKAALNLLGHEVGGLRLPLVEATEDERERVRDCLERLGLLAARRGLALGPPAAHTLPRVSLRIIPLGGLGEVGKNMTVFEHGGDIVVVDAGLAFPRDEHLGVDLVLPDFSLPARAEATSARSCSRTAHEDHVGGAAVPAARGRRAPR